MIFLFVGSSGLTEASFPRDLAIPQLLLSSACVILLTMKASRMTVFPHRGLSPLQLTPMSGAHKALEPTGAALTVSMFICHLSRRMGCLSQTPAPVAQLLRSTICVRGE